MKYVVYGLVVFLLVIHQDFWLWDNNTLIFGFMPIGLFYHACISLAAAATWYLATIFCWPAELTYDDPVTTPEKTGGEA